MDPHAQCTITPARPNPSLPVAVLHDPALAFAMPRTPHLRLYPHPQRMVRAIVPHTGRNPQVPPTKKSGLAESRRATVSPPCIIRYPPDVAATGATSTASRLPRWRWGLCSRRTLFTPPEMGTFGPEPPPPPSYPPHPVTPPFLSSLSRAPNKANRPFPQPPHTPPTTLLTYQPVQSLFFLYCHHSTLSQCTTPHTESGPIRIQPMVPSGSRARALRPTGTRSPHVPPWSGRVACRQVRPQVPRAHHPCGEGYPRLAHNKSR